MVKPIMKLVIVLPRIGVGGAETHLLNLTEEFGRSGVPVRTALLRPEGMFLEKLSGMSEVVPLLPSTLLTRLRWLESIVLARYVVRRHIVRLASYWLGGAVRLLRDVLQREPVDIVLTSLWEADVVTGLALAGIPAERRPKWVVAAAFDLEARPRVWMTAMRRLYKGANAFIAPSTRIARQLRSLVVQSSGPPIWTIPNAVRTEARPSTARQPSPDAEPALISVGRLVPEKGLDVLLRALGAVRQRLPTVRLLVIGDGPSRPSL